MQSSDKLLLDARYPVAITFWDLRDFGPVSLKTSHEPQLTLSRWSITFNKTTHWPLLIVRYPFAHHVLRFASSRSASPKTSVELQLNRVDCSSMFFQDLSLTCSTRCEAPNCPSELETYIAWICKLRGLWWASTLSWGRSDWRDSQKRSNTTIQRGESAGRFHFPFLINKTI